MEQKPFRGKYSGFLMIGEEKAEYNGKKLINYYAKPYCNNADAVEKCIELFDGKLMIRDVKSPESEQYSCIWEKEDVESAIDRIIKSAGEITLAELSCGSICKLVVPSKCKVKSGDAFENSPVLNEIITPDSQPLFPEIRFSRQKGVSGKLRTFLRLSVDVSKYAGRSLEAVLCNSPYPTTIGFQTADTHEWVGSLPAHHAFLPLFLFKQGYLELVNCKCTGEGKEGGKNYISCDIVYHDLLFQKPVDEYGSINRILGGFSIPECSMSQKFSGYYSDDPVHHITALKYTGEGCYAANGRSFCYKVKGNAIFGFDGKTEEELSGLNREYAAFYINHFRQSHHLPLIDFGEV
jgi:hypothetical protein